MVAAWGVGLFVAGLALVAVELAYPRRYLGVIGFDATLVGLIGMFLPESMEPGPRIGILAAAAVVSTLVAVPFYRRYAPHVTVPPAADVTAGNIAEVVEAITPERPGLVRARGIVWSARASQAIPAQARVRILVVASDQLVVEASDGTSPGGHDR